jgi:hypothetical protein
MPVIGAMQHTGFLLHRNKKPTSGRSRRRSSFLNQSVTAVGAGN